MNNEGNNFWRTVLSIVKNTLIIIKLIYRVYFSNILLKRYHPHCFTPRFYMFGVLNG
jgi:hypothetical protein